MTAAALLSATTAKTPSAPRLLEVHQESCDKCAAGLPGLFADSARESTAAFETLCLDSRLLLCAILRFQPGTPRLHPPRVIKRFFSHINRFAEGACHPWLLSLTVSGYGEFWVGSYKHRASRLALELRIGRLLVPEEVTRHSNSCTTRACCNGEHLSPGSPADNARDRDECGRTARGERSAPAKLTDAKVRDIRARFSHGEGIVPIASSVGVDVATCRRVLDGKTWRHVPSEDGARPEDIRAAINARRKLTPEKARLARLLLASGETQKQVGAKLGVSRSCIAHFSTGRTGKWLREQCGEATP